MKLFKIRCKKCIHSYDRWYSGEDFTSGWMLLCDKIQRTNGCKHVKKMRSCKHYENLNK